MMTKVIEMKITDKTKKNQKMWMRDTMIQRKMKGIGVIAVRDIGIRKELDVTTEKYLRRKMKTNLIRTMANT
jgi:hypothetical protein